jgi:negative regulator of flagellin synthesis FlgM
MSNTIDSSSGIKPMLTGASERLGQARPATASAAPASASGSRGDDTVRITGDAMQLQSLEKSIGGEPAFDSQRVEALRAAIAEGRYQPDPERIAGKMLGSNPPLA